MLRSTPAGRLTPAAGLCDQVAAVCYRIREHAVEFLLVRTSAGRWTFPKGRLEPSFTHAQTAALEAREEAGVHGWIEEFAFARYVHRKRDRGAERRELIVDAYLCEVLRLNRPNECGRERTWFCQERTKYRLQERRPGGYGDELIAVVDRAIARIDRLHFQRGAHFGVRPNTTTDALRRVYFEAPSARPETWDRNAELPLETQLQLADPLNPRRSNLLFLPSGNSKGR